MKIRISILLIFITISIISFSGCLNKENNNRKSQSDNSYYEFRIEILTNLTNQYQLFLPVAINFDDNGISEIMNTLHIEEGDVDINKSQSIYGKILQIKGFGNAILYSYEKKYVPYAFLSTTNTTFQDINSIRNGDSLKFWVFYNGSESSIKLKISLSVWHYNELKTISISNFPDHFEIKKGWNQYTILIYLPPT